MVENKKITQSQILIIVGIVLVTTALGFLCWRMEFFGLFQEESNTEKGYLLADGKKIIPDRVFTIGDYEISFDEYRYYYLNCKRELDGGNETFFQTYPQYESVLKDKVMKKIMHSYGALELARLNNVKLTAEQLTAANQAVEGQEAFVKMLNEGYLNEEVYRELFKKSCICENAYDYFFGEKGKYAMSKEEYLEYFDKNYLAVYHIFIDYVDKEDPYSCEKTMEKAMGMYDLALAEEADFFDLYKQYNENDEMNISEKGCYFTRDNAPYQVYYTTALETEFGKISKPFATYAGICILKRIALDDEVALDGMNDILNGTGSDAGYYELQFENMYNQVAEKMIIVLDDCYEMISTSTLF